MRNRAAILALAVLVAVTLFIGLHRAGTLSIPPSPPSPETADEGGLPPLPPLGSQGESSPHPTSSGRSPTEGFRRPRPMELALLSGSTGRIVRTERIAFTRRIRPTEEQIPPPFVAAEDLFEWNGPVSIFAERVRVTTVVWPELDLTVEIQEADGTPARDAVVSQIRQGGEHRTFTAERIGASAEFRIRGVPWMREEPLFVAATARANPTADEEGVVSEEVKPETASAHAGLIPEDPVRVRIRLPAPESVIDDPVIKDAKVSDHNETDNDLPFEESMRSGEAGPELRVRVRRADGSPTAGVLLRAYSGRPEGGFVPYSYRNGRTDAEGVLVLNFQDGDAVGIAVDEPGFLCAKKVPATPAHPPAEILLREDPGADLDVFVVDGEGRPLPGAEITVEHPHWVWLENGVQQFGLYSGPDGRVRLPRLPLRDLTIRAHYGSRHAKVMARPPGRVELRLPRRK